MFPSPLRKLRDISNTDNALKVEFEAAGFPWMTSHTIRRTVATNLHDAGLTDREVANQTGHKKISLMQDVYLDRRQPVKKAAEIL